MSLLSVLLSLLLLALLTLPSLWNLPRNSPKKIQPSKLTIVNVTDIWAHMFFAPPQYITFFFHHRNMSHFLRHRNMSHFFCATAICHVFLHCSTVRPCLMKCDKLRWRKKKWQIAVAQKNVTYCGGTKNTAKMAPPLYVMLPDFTWQWAGVSIFVNMILLSLLSVLLPLLLFLLSLLTLLSL